MQNVRKRKDQMQHVFLVARRLLFCLFHLTTLSIAWIIQRAIITQLVKNDVEMLRKESVLAYYKTVYYSARYGLYGPGIESP
jgi:hypothetical protein